MARHKGCRCGICGDWIEREEIAGDIRLILSFRSSTRTEQAGKVCLDCVAAAGAISLDAVSNALRAVIQQPTLGDDLLDDA